VYGKQAVYIGSGARLRGRSWWLWASSLLVIKEGECASGKVFVYALQAPA
jgi:hypothetical protein